MITDKYRNFTFFSIEHIPFVAPFLTIFEEPVLVIILLISQKTTQDLNHAGCNMHRFERVSHCDEGKRYLFC